MPKSDFDAIVVGAGCAGTVAAYELAKAGKSVLLVERGNYPGSKNMTGGRIYTHSLHKVFTDNELAKAPFERRITHERISLMSSDANFTVDFSSEQLKERNRESYSVLCVPFDQWLAGEAERAGAECFFGIPVEGLMRDDAGKVCGIRAGEDEITAEVVILADGVNSLLTAEAVGAHRPSASQLAVGIKQTFTLPADRITDRVLAQSDDDGAAWLFAGDATHGIFGGGFMYTNRASISLGVVAGIEATAAKGKTSVAKMLEDLKAHPAVAPLIAGAQLVEHSGHMVPEGGINSMPRLTGDGVLVVGDAAMMCINLGYMVRGMDYAVAAGQIAGQAAAMALDADDTSASGLAGYQRMLDDSFIMKDLRQYAGVPAFMENFNRMFQGYPEMARDMMNRLFSVDGNATEPLKSKMKPILKQVGIRNMVKDARGALKVL